MEYVDLSLLTLNIPQAVHLLKDIDKIIEAPCPHSTVCKFDWIHDYRAARLATMRGSCMLESGEYSLAKKYLLKAMKLYGCPFPTSPTRVKFCNMNATIEQNFSLYCTKRFKRYKGYSWIRQYYDHIANTLNTLFALFTACKESNTASATLAAKLSLKFARQNNNTFRLLCTSYGNMICAYRENRCFSKCVKLEKLAMEICDRKRGRLEITEIYAVCNLYTNIFLFYAAQGNNEGLRFGLSVVPMMAGQSVIVLGQMLVLRLLKILLYDLRISEMVVIMREFFYITDHYDLSSEAWYYYYALIIVLDTGLCVETYSACMKFYIKQGDAIIRSKTPEAAWNFFACMWILTLRIGAWESAILWHGKVEQINISEWRFTEYHIMMLLRLVEGYLILLVEEIDKRNLKKVLALDEKIQSIFKRCKEASGQIPLYRPRYLFLCGYYHMVKGKKSSARNYLDQAETLAKQMNHKVMKIIIEHTKSHWSRTLTPRFANYWTEHVDILDYRSYNSKTRIFPYTMPLPKDLEF